MALTLLLQRWNTLSWLAGAEAVKQAVVAGLVVCLLLLDTL